MNQHVPASRFKAQPLYQHSWTDAEKAQVVQMKLDGKTAGRAAQIMSFQIGATITRNSIIGIWKRAGASTPTPQSRGRKTKAVVSPPPKRPVKIKLFPRLPPAPVCKPAPGPPPPAPSPVPIVFGRLLTIMECRDGLCRYAVNAARPFMFCGAAVEGKGPYCPGHHALAHVPLKNATAGERRAHQP